MIAPLYKSMATGGPAKRNIDVVFTPQTGCAALTVFAVSPLWVASSAWGSQTGDPSLSPLRSALPTCSIARIYVGVPLLGGTKTLLCMPLGNSDGWC
jgi:hypothetical protein